MNKKTDNPSKPRFSFGGYSMKEWVRGTLETFKGLTAAVVGVAVYVANAAPEPYSAVLAPVAVAASKWVLDAVHFWASEK